MYVLKPDGVAGLVYHGSGVFWSNKPVAGEYGENGLLWLSPSGSPQSCLGVCGACGFHGSEECDGVAILIGVPILIGVDGASSTLLSGVLAESHMPPPLDVVFEYDGGGMLALLPSPSTGTTVFLGTVMTLFLVWSSTLTVVSVASLTMPM